MNEKLISWVKKYVNMMLWPLEWYYYHQYEHALEVTERCVELAQKEWLNEEQTEILALASLFHDTGFVIQYDNNEYIWASIAKNYLKWVLYPEEKIKIVQELIISTNYFHTPQNILEQIIRDADTDNLWRDDFFEKWERLKRELETIKKIKILDPDWVHYSITFLRKHKFQTQTEIKERQPKKMQNLRELEKKIINNYVKSHIFFRHI